MTQLKWERESSNWRKDNIANENAANASIKPIEMMLIESKINEDISLSK